MGREDRQEDDVMTLQPHHNVQVLSLYGVSTETQKWDFSEINIAMLDIMSILGNND